MKIFFLILFMTTSLNNFAKNGKIILPNIFSDNMVLQQNAEVSFWGKALPNQQIKINTSWGDSVKTLSLRDSSWVAEIKTPAAGGPYEIIIQSNDSLIKFENVLIGEVWLCSGQSNMEMPLEGWEPVSPIKNSAEEIKNANYSQIRLFTAARAVSNKPEFNVRGKWEECNPSTAAKFSATAYFFGKKLYEDLKIPIGLIHSSWGGTPIEAWTSGKYLREVKRYDSTLNKIANSSEEIKIQENWIKDHRVIDIDKKELSGRWKNLEFADSLCALPNFMDTGWAIMNLPTIWENSEMENFDGAVWFRKKIKIPSILINKNLIMELGPIDDMDRTFVNGRLVGSIETDGFWQQDRIYEIPKNIITDTVLTIAVRVIDTQGGGGIYGDKNKMKIYTDEHTSEISIAGDWKYLPVAEFKNMKFYIYGYKGDYFSRPKTSVEISAYTPSILYNAMIAPIIPYKIKGAIWYQGEANTGDPKFYKTLLPLLIRNWKEDWNEKEFPFYFVQIAPYDYGDSTKSQILRESQMLSLSVPNTGMAVTLDIGEPENIHPANKADVGKRLALWALAKNYNKKIIYSGPVYYSMKIDKGKIIISFDYTDGGLILKNNMPGDFLIAGSDKNFIDAEVEIKDDKLIVFNSKIKNPVSVRYAWSNTPNACLFNKAGLPASSFRTDNWDY